MKTDDLIAALALEPGFPGPGRLAGRLVLWSGAGALVAAVLTVVAMGPRPDLSEGPGLASFMGKAGFTLTLAAAGLWLTRRLGQPGVSARRPLLALILLAGGLSATAYGLHCAESAVSFLVVWYGLGVLATAVMGAALGARFLRW